jgi:hypothetical protein
VTVFSLCSQSGSVQADGLSQPRRHEGVEPIEQVVEFAAVLQGFGDTAQQADRPGLGFDGDGHTEGEREDGGALAAQLAHSLTVGMTPAPKSECQCALFQVAQPVAGNLFNASGDEDVARMVLDGRHESSQHGVEVFPHHHGVMGVVVERL